MAKDKNPPPPAIGAKYIGPQTRLGKLHGTYHVRAVVDVYIETPSVGYTYQVVLRYWSPSKGWRYVIESAQAFSVGLYKPKEAT